MANTKISALTSGSPAQVGDLIPIDRGGSNFSVTAGSIVSAMTPITGDIFVGPGLQPFPMNGVNTSKSTLNGLNSQIIANGVVAVKFTLTRPFIVSKVSWAAVDVSAGSKVSFGLYDSSLAQVVYSGVFDGGISTAQTNSITPVTLLPGVYWLAMTASDLVVSGVVGVNITTGSYWNVYINSGSVKIGTAANTATAGVLPANLGSITNTIGASVTNYWIPIFE